MSVSVRRPAARRGRALRRLAPALAPWAAALALAGPASAQPAGGPTDRPTGAAAERSAVPSGALATPPPRPEPDGPAVPRVVPDLDGRADPPPPPGARWLAVPRVLLFPLYVLFEYALRRPIGFVLTESERLGLGAIFDFLLFDEARGGVVPLAFFDFDFQPSGGLHVYHDALGARRHKLQVWGSTGGRRWWRGTVKDRVPLADGRRFEVAVDAWRRPDYLFYGLGPTTPARDRSRYTRTFLHAEASLRQALLERGALTWRVFLAHERFGDTAFGDEPSVPESVDAGRFPLPPGFARGYTAVGHRLDATFDTRRSFPAPGGGVLLDGFVAQAFDAEAPRAAWVHYGATAAAFHDLGARRVLGAALHAQEVRATGAGEVPFTERVMLGLRPVLLGGFVPGRLVGDSALVCAATYAYPIWALADATVHASVGNVFDRGFAGLHWERLRLSFGLGLKTSRSPDQAFTVQVAFGSAPFGDGARIESVRAYFGVTQL